MTESKESEARSIAVLAFCNLALGTARGVSSAKSIAVRLRRNSWTVSIAERLLITELSLELLRTSRDPSSAALVDDVKDSEGSSIADR